MSKDHACKLQGPDRQLDFVLDCQEDLIELLGIGAELKIKELRKGSLDKDVVTPQDGLDSSQPHDASAWRLGVHRP